MEPDDFIFALEWNHSSECQLHFFEPLCTQPFLVLCSAESCQAKFLVITNSDDQPTLPQIAMIAKLIRWTLHDEVGRFLCPLHSSPKDN